MHEGSFEAAAQPGELLAQGVARWGSGAAYRVAPEGYGRITVAGPPRAPDEALVCVDLETLGFIGRPLFLVGALYAGAGPAAEGGTRLVQYLARDYSEEEVVLRAFADEARGVPTWITFNGRTFDVPNLQLRATFHRVQPPSPGRHVDLLPVARRLWGPGLPDCRLQTLEHRICGRRPRLDDIPGIEIPRAYHEFVRTGEPWEMLRILEHNAADLFSLYQLLREARGRGFDPLAEAG